MQTNWEWYKVAKKKAMCAMTTAQMTTFERLYLELEDKGEDKKLYRLAKARERRAHNMDQAK